MKWQRRWNKIKIPDKVFKIGESLEGPVKSRLCLQDACKKSAIAVNYYRGLYKIVSKAISQSSANLIQKFSVVLLLNIKKPMITWAFYIQKLINDKLFVCVRRNVLKGETIFWNSKNQVRTSLLSEKQWVGEMGRGTMIFFIKAVFLQMNLQENRAIYADIVISICIENALENKWQKEFFGVLFLFSPYLNFA